MTDRALRWPLLLASLLALSVGSNVWLLVRAAADPGFAVEPDYYRRAVEWDRTRAVEDASRALGWSARLEIDERSTDPRTVTLKLDDRDGAPVRGADVSIEALHLAQSARSIHGALAEASPGVYRAEVTLARAGRWEIRLEARKDGDRFLETIRRDLLPIGAE